MQETSRDRLVILQRTTYLTSQKGWIVSITGISSDYETSTNADTQMWNELMSWLPELKRSLKWGL